MHTATEKRDLGQILIDCFGARAGMYREILRGFKEVGIKFIVINLPIHFSMGKRPNDLDLVLDNEGYMAAVRFLESHGYLRLDRSPGPRQVLYVGFDRDNGFVRVHLHENLVFHGITLLTLERASHYTRMWDGICIADECLDYYLLHIEWFFRGKADYPRRIEEVSKHCDPTELSESRRQLFGCHVPLIERLIALRQQGAIPTSWRRLVNGMLYTRGKAAVIAHIAKRAAANLDWLLLWRRRGVMVFVMGIDGTGKTTLAKKIVARHDSGGLFCHYRYLGLKDTTVQRLRQRIKPRDPHERERGQKGIADSLAARSRLLANLFNLALSFVYIMEYMVRCVLVLRPIRKHNDVIIVDRTYLDKLMDLNRWGNELFFHLLPRPDFVVALHGDPEVLYRRKGEFAVPVLVSMQNKMDTALSFIENRGIGMIRIDTTQHNEAETAALVQERLWRIVKDRDSA